MGLLTKATATGATLAGLAAGLAAAAHGALAASSERETRR
jgi:hypothetical protein